MATWQFSIGNLAQRAAHDPEPVSPAVSDTLLPLTNLSTGYPDEEAAFEWRSDGNYAVTVNLNLLANTSDRTDAPTGWRDLQLDYAGTPGLGSNAPDWNTYASRTSIRIYKPMFQDVEVMPGENMSVVAGLYLSNTSAATACQVRVVNTGTGLSWDGANSAWESDGVVEVQSNTNAWEDFTESVVWDNTNCTERTVYRVVIEPVANSYGANSFVYVSDSGGSGSPGLYGESDFCALIGHNLPVGSNCTFGNFSFTDIYQPSAWCVLNSAETITEANLTFVVGTNQPRPRIGEFWVGKLTTFVRGVDPDIELNAGDAAQLRVQGAGGRQEVVSDLRIPLSMLRLKVRCFTDDQYDYWRNRVTRGTRFGADPMVLVPPTALDGDSIIHGRVGPVLATRSKDQSWREFQVDLAESPFSPSR
jgi:hypothetical protein